MAHYAYIDSNNIVVDVIVGKDENELIDGLSPEDYYAKNTSFRVIRTSFNHRIRKQYAGIGFTYDQNADVFVAPKPFPSWTLNQNHDWQAPKPEPTSGRWRWDESQLDWVEFDPQS